MAAATALKSQASARLPARPYLLLCEAELVKVRPTGRTTLPDVSVFVLREIDESGPICALAGGSQLLRLPPPAPA